MEYTKQTWTAPTGNGLSRYAKSAESASHVTLTLDPENLTNSPTPFTAERMAHIEEGIAKAYDTAPPTPWAQYSGKDIPQLPDNVAGTTYKRDNDWVDTDGWDISLSSSTLSVENNVLVVTPTGSVSYTAIARTGNNAGKTVVAVIRKTTGNYKIQARPLSGGYIDMVYVANELGDGKVLLVSYIPTGYDWLRIYGDQNTTPFYMEAVYIGTGAYDRLVFDNSYHYRHLLNNAVVPTPQGLYFNGSTSYLRSKDKVTLPDVFTFSATVNCAIKSTAQAFCCIGQYATPTIPFMWILRSQDTNNLSIPASDGTARIPTVFMNYFSGYENIDVDVKVEIDFVSKTIKAYRNGIQFGSVVSSPTMVKPVDDYMFLGRSNVEYLLGYMRNICLFDTSLTDTQRNWLAQGNTPPILYDVTNYETEGYVSIQDADGTNTGGETYVDNNGNRILKLPATIKANVIGKANVRVSLRHGNTWFAKSWNGGLTDFVGERVWTDGANIYYSYGTAQYELNKSTSTWVAKTWNGLTDFTGSSIWTDGDNIYYSNETNQYVLNKSTSTWVAKIWSGLTNFIGYHIWTDGEIIYLSNGTAQYELNKSTSTWVAKTWSGLTNFIGSGIWTDGDNIYYSNGTAHYVLNKATSTWTTKTWNGLTNFIGYRTWTDGDNIYYSYETSQYVLNKATSTWVAKTWSGLTDFTGIYIWTDGDNIYYSNATTHYVLPATRHNYVDDDKYNSLFGTVTRCDCLTLTNRFVYSNE